MTDDRPTLPSGKAVVYEARDIFDLLARTRYNQVLVDDAGRPRKVKIFSRPTSLYCATSCNRHGKQKSALVEPQCFPPLRLST